jgi:predicted acyl esterase
MQIGRFIDGPLIGVDYKTPSLEGVTDTVGAFRFRDGEIVAWSIGRLSLGSSKAKDQITPADLVPGSDDHPQPLMDPRVINRARFLHSLASETDLSRGIVISPVIRAGIDPLADRIVFDQDETGFSADPSLRGLFQMLGLRLRSAEESRNHLRRSLAGIKKIVDVKVPTRDDSYLLADIYHPPYEGRYPVILRLSVYGKAFGSGSVCSPEDYLGSEKREDAWFQQQRKGLGPSLRYAENVVSANTMDWVPRGYVLVRVDGRGVGSTPGVLNPFSRQEAEDYYDVIEWAAVQPWSNGKVGLYGASYAATIQWNVAALKPPSLQAMIPWAGDADSYRDLSYPGGIFNEGYRRQWWANLLGNSCGAETVNLIDDMLAHPFDEPEFYGPQGKGPLSADFNHITIPFLTAVSQTGVLHSRAGFEAFSRSPSSCKRLVVVDANYFPFLYRDCLEDQFNFFNRWLQGKEEDKAKQPSVRMIMRTGQGGFEWREEETWPVPGTVYRSLFLDAGEKGSFVGVDPAKPSFYLVESPAPGAQASYSAGVEGIQGGVRSGTSFLSDLLVEDLELAGHFTAILWVSSTSFDLDVYVALRVIGPDGGEVPYAVYARQSKAPVTWGCLKVSQRKLDPVLSTMDRPWHTHRRIDRALLGSPNEIVQIEVELMPATARISAGNHLRLDVQPVEGEGGFLDAQGRLARRAYDPSYHQGAENKIHTGDRFPSSLRIPVVPRRT